MIFTRIRFKKKQRKEDKERKFRKWRPSERQRERGRRETGIYTGTHIYKDRKIRNIDLEKLGDLQKQSHKERGRQRNTERERYHKQMKTESKRRENVQIRVCVHAPTPTHTQSQSKRIREKTPSPPTMTKETMLLWCIGCQILDTAGSKYSLGQKWG